ncbi:LOW QUALITY PROTEIN: nuclear factor 7, ovary-like [Anomaloglossus baeobatrachus]
MVLMAVITCVTTGLRKTDSSIISLYTDPVSLRCGHFFCRSCIVVYACPDCRTEYPERPAFEKNQTLRNIVERFSSTQPEMEETGIFCTYCIKSPVPAVKSCLQCENSMCKEHLTAHNKTMNHDLIEPTRSFISQKCSTHKELLKYYCPRDNACICVSCYVAGAHKGHDVEPLDVASEKKKQELRPLMKKLKSKKEEAGGRVQILKNHETEQRKKSSGLADRVTGLFTDLRKKLDDLEKKMQGEISRQKDQVLRSVSELVGIVELQMDELTKQISHLEGLCNTTDRLSLLQGVNNGDISFESNDVLGDVRDAQCVDEDLVSQILQGELGRFADDLIDMKKKRKFSVTAKKDILLDINTANNNIIISQDLRSAFYTATSQNRPDGPKRFKSRQVLSSSSFSSGRHYWEVDVSRAEKWIIGVAGQSLQRDVAGDDSYIGYNEKSWAIMFAKNLFASHRKIHKQLPSGSPVQVVGIYLDYEAGRLSFYQVCDAIRHLHTFTASFSEPLHPALYLYEGCILRIVK